MVSQWNLIYFLIPFTLAGTALAQIDPSSALLLNSGTGSVNREGGLDSGRYTVRPKTDQSRRDDPRANSRKAPLPETQPASAPGSPHAPAQSIDNSGERAGTTVNTESGVHPGQGSPHHQADDRYDHGVGARPSSPPAGFRRNTSFIEITLGPGYLYNDSDSDYAYRNYQAAAPLLAVDARVWLLTNLAVRASYTGTLGGHIQDSLMIDKKLAAPQRWFTAGVQGKQYFGDDLSAPSFIYGLDYQEYQLEVPRDSELRARIQSVGAQIFLEANIPVGAYHSSILGFSLMPKLRHTESPTTIDFTSGGGVDANAVSFWFGSRYVLDSSNTIFWKISQTVEKDLFSGEASQVDPITGSKPTGVSVTNSFTLFQLGYIWGN
jgi:hypothetical protein